VSAEDRAVRLKRLRIRSWRRGTREMDLILGGYADEALETLDLAGLDGFEALLEEDDHDLYLWVAGSGDVPERHAGTVARLRAWHGTP
jgi:antitoxin CptB